MWHRQTDARDYYKEMAEDICSLTASIATVFLIHVFSPSPLRLCYEPVNVSRRFAPYITLIHCYLICLSFSALEVVRRCAI